MRQEHSTWPAHRARQADSRALHATGTTSPRPGESFPRDAIYAAALGVMRFKAGLLCKTSIPEHNNPAVADTPRPDSPGFRLRRGSCAVCLGVKAAHHAEWGPRPRTGDVIIRTRFGSEPLLAFAPGRMPVSDRSTLGGPTRFLT
jgi:hypothetical protein